MKLVCWLLVSLLGAGVTVADPSSILLNEADYPFEKYVEHFGRSYSPEEYETRKQIYNTNLKHVVNHNRQHASSKGGYVLGVNQFADLREDEWHLGYDKYQNHLYKTTSATKQQRRLQETVNFAKLGISLDSVNILPKAVDWRTKGVTTPVKNQGMCGSCWAFASTAVLESHIAIQTGNLFPFSTQELVSCAPNTQHCGGTGGCAGATANVAYDLVQKYGVVEEDKFGYQDAFGAKVKCALKADVQKHNRTFYNGAVAGIVDYAVLPSNNYTALMNTVAKLGPVAVSVACSPWMLYQSGVFHAPLKPGRNTDIDHLVVVEGYGQDEETGEKYWLVRNSWSPLWGEHGYIRLRRVGEDECAMDNSPADGDACTIDKNGNEVTPEPQLVCGNSGILFDAVIPLGGFMI